MPADRDDAPPGEAVEAIEMTVARMAARSTSLAEDARDTIMPALRTLPAAARWRLIGWLAQGLEPTEAMVDACSHARVQMPLRDSKGRSTASITAALAAAREARDE